MSTPVGDIVLIPRRLPDAMPWWRFSLREFLLAATAAAALVALAVKSFPSSPSSFVRQFDARYEFENLCDAEGIRLEVFTSAGGGTSGPGSSRRRWDMTGQLKGRSLGETRDLYSLHVREALKQHGCSVTGGGTTGETFGFHYRCGSRQGEFVADFVELPSGYFKMHAFCVEFTRR